MSGVTLKPIDGGESITVPTESQTVIGRGNFLQVLDKRVSRNHGMLEIVDGTLFLTPTHANPCFYQKKGTKDKLALLKDQQKRLEAGDMFGLLPDKFFYEVTYGTVQNGKIEQKELNAGEKEGKDSKKDSNKESDKDAKKDGKGNEKESKKDAEDKKKDKNDSKKNTKEGTDSAATKDKSDKTGKQDDKTAGKEEESSGKEASDSSTQKKRKLPEWLVNTSTPATESSPEQKEKPQKTTSRRGGGRGRPPKRNKPKYVESDDDAEVVEKPVKRRRRATRVVDPDEAGSSESSPPARRPSRAAAAKRNSYVDDFVIGDEYSDDDLRYRRRTYKEDDDDDENDEDFIAWEDEDSGSDWEKNKGANRGRVSKTLSKSRTSAKKMPLKPKSVGRKKRKRRNDDSDEELDSYIPRPSRRRAAARAQKVEVEGEEDEEEEEEKEKEKEKDKGKEKEKEKEAEVTPKASNTEKKRVPCKKNTSHLKELSHPVDDAAKGADKDDSQTGGEKEEAKEKRAPEKEKPECQYGVGCYRKNSQHRKEFKHTIQPEPVSRPKRMTTTLKVTGVDEDFSDPPPSDESMDEDSEWEPEAESVGSSKLKAAPKK